MRKDQFVFLLAGVVLGVVVGLVFGLAGSGHLVSDLGTPPAPPSAPAASGGAPQGGSPGMDALTARVQMLREQLAANPQNPQVLAELGELFLESNMVDQGLAHLERSLAVAPGDAQLHARAAFGFNRVGQGRRALELAQKAMDLDKGDPRLAESAAQIAIHGAGDLDAAKAAIDDLRRRAPAGTTIAPLEAELARVRGLFETADARPGDFQAQASLGNYLYDIARWPDAEKAYRRAVNAKPDAAGVITDLGYVVYRQGRSAESLELFEQALRANPTQWQAAFNGTIVATEMRDGATARRWIERLKLIKPDLAEIPGLEQGVRNLGA